MSQNMKVVELLLKVPYQLVGIKIWEYIKKIPAEVKLPYNFEAIVRHADSQINKSSTEELFVQLYNGAFLNQKRKKFWVEIKAINNFMLFARELEIAWGGGSRYWKWIPVEETSDHMLVEAAELNTVCFLDIKGKFDTKDLSPETSYEVAFVIMMKHNGAGGEKHLVKLGLQFPDGMEKEHREDFAEIETRNQWKEISVGQFLTTSKKQGEMKINLRGTEKQGIVINGVIIRHIYPSE